MKEVVDVKDGPKYGARDVGAARRRASSRVHRTILVIDDQWPLRRLLQHALRGRYRVLEAEGHDSAMAIMNREPVDLVLLDLHLPPQLDSPLEGLQIYSDLHERSPHLPVVIVTGNSDPALRDELLRRGARGFLKKPFDFDQVAGLVEGLIG